MKIPITKPYFDEKEPEAAKKAVESGWIIQGPKTKEFEDKIAEYVHAKHAIAVSSCTTALHLSLIAAGIKAGDEVICPSFTFIATPNSIEYTGAKPVFVDIDEETYNINPELIEEKITEKTKAILPVDQVGLSCDHDKMQKIAKKHSLNIIEDAAPAIGAKYKNKMIGAVSDLTCFSFHPRKIITTAEGGMITTDNDGYAEKLRMLRSFGTKTTPLERLNSNNILTEEYSELGYNYRITDIQSAIGIEQMKKLPEILEKRRNLAKIYDEELSKINNLTTPYVPNYTNHTYQTYVIKVLEKDRNQIMKKLLEKQIACKIGVEICHTQSYYTKKYGKTSLPKTEKAHKSTILIPLYPSMTQEEQEYVIKCLKEAVNKC